jgi:hypothetical protein
MLCQRQVNRCEQARVLCAGKGGATNGMIRGMQVGFELLGVVYGWWGAGRAAQLMLAKATWLPHTTLAFSMVRNVL